VKCSLVWKVGTTAEKQLNVSIFKAENGSSVFLRHWIRPRMPWLRNPRYERAVPLFNMSVASFPPRGPVHMGFVAEEVLGQVFLRVLRFLSPSGIIPPISLLRVLGDKKLPVLALTAVQFKTPHAFENEKEKKNCSYQLSVETSPLCCIGL